MCEELVLSPRARSLSESVSSSTSRGAYTPRKPLQKTQLAASDSANTVESSKTGQSTSYETVESKVGSPDSGGAFSPSQDTLVEDNTRQQHQEATPQQQQQQQRLSPATKVKVEGSKVKVEGSNVGDEEADGEFGRHVRGTSTPIDDVSPLTTPTRDRSHTFDTNYDGSNLEEQLSVAAASTTSAAADREPLAAAGPDHRHRNGDGGAGVEEEVKRTTLRREEALDRAPDSLSNGGDADNSSL